jgi:hypothetical protein
MESMKKRGWREVDSALRRVRSLHALGRIGVDDKLFIEGRLQDVLGRINSMNEEDKNGDPIGGGE